MRPATTYLDGNTLLDYLISIGSHEALRGADVISFNSGQVLLDTNASIEHVYFPIDMMISNTTLMRDGSEIEVGTVGREGVAGGIQIVLGIEQIPGKSLCQVAGTAARIPAGEFRRCAEESVPWTSHMRATDTFARFGGDEFVVLKLQVRASIRIAICPSDGIRADDSLHRADISIYCAQDSFARLAS